MHVCSDERNYESRRYRHTANELLNRRGNQYIHLYTDIIAAMWHRSKRPPLGMFKNQISRMETQTVPHISQS